jgi:uncharacterized protein YbjT (DUF2867 family)
MKPNSTHLILVIGGTGTQGGNVARELLAHGHRVRVLTRDPESTASKQMAAKGAEIVQGDMADLASLEPAMENVLAIFSVQYADPYDPSVEPRNAANMVQAAQKAGIEQVVHTSVAGSNQFPRWDKYQILTEYWDHKYDIEESIRNGGFRYWTILHPCWFMENYLEPNVALMAPELKNGVMFGNLNGDIPVQLSSGGDTAKFARAAFENPGKFSGKDINVAGDELSMTQIAETLSSVLDKEIVYEKVSSEEAIKRGMLKGTVYSMEWMEDVGGYGFDIQETKEYGVLFKSFAEWVEENRDRF